MTPEEKLARRLSARHNLQPPVKILELAQVYATVERVALPVAGEAVMIHDPEGNRSPQILLSNRGVSEARERFTIAHEIGHIIIGWHFGILECHVSESDFNISDNYSVAEAEANRFASELLIPTDWLKDFILNCRSMKDLFEGVVNIANVSPEAARIKLIKFLPNGYACVVDRKDGTPPKLTSSGGTNISLFLEPGDRTNASRLDQSLSKYSIDTYDLNRYSESMRFYKLECRDDLPDYRDSRPSTELLDLILKSFYGSSELVLRRSRVINGNVSVANVGTLDRSEESLFAMLRLVFGKADIQKDVHLYKITNHPDFERFLVIKARELASGNNQTRRKINGKRPTPKISDQDWEKGFKLGDGD